MDIPDEGDYDTVGGMVFSCLHEIPEDGQTFTIEINSLRITVTKVEDKRIVEAVVEKIVEPEGSGEDGRKDEQQKED